MFLLAFPATHNLGNAEATMLRLVLASLGAIVGLIGGLSIGRRQSSVDAGHYGTVAGWVCGIVCGAGYALTILAAYLVAFGGEPVDTVDWLLVIASFPVLGSLGGLVGGIIGALLGRILGAVCARTIRSNAAA
jgi:hypothetical protein